jgi:integrase
MPNAVEDTEIVRKGKRGYGRLYKRDGAGKEHPVTSKVKGAFWLEYRVEGKRFRVPLRDEEGEPVRDRRRAEKARERIVTPLVATTETERWEAVQAKVAAARRTEQQAHIECAPLRIDGTWDAYRKSTRRPDSGERTLADYRSYLRRFTEWLKGVHPRIENIGGVTTNLAAEYAGELSTAGVSANTFNKHISFLRLLFDVLSERVGLGQNPFGGITRKKQRINSRRELAIAEVTELLTRGQGDLPLLVGIGVFTGLRLGDCATLQWSNIDPARRIITRVPNKTARSRPDKLVKIGVPQILAERLKAISANKRGTYVLPRVAALYKKDPTKLSRRIQRHFINCGIDIHRPGTGRQILRDKDGQPVRDKKGNVKLAAPTGVRAVVETGFHSLRHTYVSLHAERGTPAAVLQDNVGHTNPAMTQHYAHVSDRAAKEYADSLAQALIGDGDKIR